MPPPTKKLKQLTLQIPSSSNQGQNVSPVNETPMFFNDEQNHADADHLKNSDDIGEFVGKRNISDDVIYRLLTVQWKPPTNFSMPFQSRTVNGKTCKVHLSETHLKRAPFLK